MTVRKMGIEYNGKDIQAVVFDLDGTLYRISFLTKMFFVLNNIRHQIGRAHV